MRPLALAALTAMLAAPTIAQTGGPAERPFTPAFSITVPLGPGGPARASLSRRAVLEMGAVALTGAGHLVASSRGLSGAYIPVVVLGWGGYIGARAVRDPQTLRELGLTREGLGPAFRDATVVAAVSLAAMAAVGAAQGSLRVDASLLPLLVLYPVWGLTQQTLVQGMLTRNLDAAGLPALAVVPLSAVAFGSVHVPNVPLAAATTALGGAFSVVYLRHGNVLPLGLYHGVLGAAFYVWVLDRDPWRELVGE
ncbi:MAG TPA: CPBP family glutamic-type intramembrane protease [Rubricoccaceae bacterium]|jgi:membrane protease YdiL (CAAX protease family)